MDMAAPSKYRYGDPKDITTTLLRMDTTGTPLVFSCPLCGKPASHDRLYLAWRTYQGDYELRATFAAERGREKITPRGHHKHFSLVMLNPKATTCIVCEGLFSALAHAQLFPREDVWYVILNSVTNWRKLVAILDTVRQTKITHLCLALDNDPAGRTT